MPNKRDRARQTETLAQDLSADHFIQEFRTLLQEGWTPDLEEFLARVPGPIRLETEQAAAAILAERELDAAGAGCKPRVRNASAELKSWTGDDRDGDKERADDEYVRDYVDLLDEGWTPDLDEYLDMVPEAKRDPIRKAIQVVLAEREQEARVAATRAKIKSTAAEFEALAAPTKPPVTVAGLVAEYERLLDQGLIPDVDEFLARLPESLHPDARGRIQALLDARGLRIAAPVPVNPEAEQLVAEYARLLDEGWRPDIDEYLARVPKALREEVEAEVRRLRDEADATVAAAERETEEALSILADEVCDRTDEADAEADAEAEAEAEADAEAEAAAEDTADAAGPEEAGLAAEEDETDATERETEEALALFDVEVVPEAEATLGAAVEDDVEPACEPELEFELEPEPDAELVAPDDVQEVVEAGPEELAALFAAAEADAVEPDEPTAASDDVPIDPLPDEGEAPEAVVEAAPPPVVPGLRHEQDLGGRTFLAWDEARARHVVAKRFLPGTPDDVQQAALDEAKRAAALGDDTIVGGDTLAKNALVAEFVEGEPIDVAAPQLPYDRCARLLLRAARALAAAHDAGIPHLGLSPERMLVTPARNVRILGFGFGAVESGRADAYAAPEQLEGSEIWQPSDVFSFGAVMYAALTGRAPFAGATPEGIRAAMAERVTFPRQLDAGLPADLQAICLSCLHEDPAQRPAMSEVAADLDRFDTGRPARLRPHQYRSAVRAGLREHRAQLDLWEQQALTTGDDRDDLEVVYGRVSDREEHWRFDAWRLTPRRVALYAGCALVAAALCAFAWFGGTGMLPAITVVVLLGAGAFARERNEPVAACAFLGTGSLAAAPAAYALHPDPAVAAGIGLALSLASFAWLRVALFAWTTVALVTGAIAGLAHAFGFAPAGYAALAALLPASLALPRASWAQPFRWTGALALVGAPLLLRGHVSAAAGLSFLDAWYAVLALHGLVLIGLQALLDRTIHLDLRRTARVFEWVGVAVLLGALFANAFAHGTVSSIATYVAAPLALLAAAPWRRRRVFLVTGLLGLAAGCYLPLATGAVAAGTFALVTAGVGAVVALGVALPSMLR